MKLSQKPISQELNRQLLWIIFQMFEFYPWSFPLWLNIYTFLHAPLGLRPIEQSPPCVRSRVSRCYNMPFQVTEKSLQYEFVEFDLG
jgi:hypothetical protein